MGELSKISVALVDSLDQAWAFKRWLGERRPRNVLGLDTETSGLNPYQKGAEIRLMQFGDGEMGWAIPWEDWRGLCLEALDAWEGDWCGHNLAAFDIQWIEYHSKHRFQRHRIRDGMIAAHIVDPLGPGGLKPLSQKLVDPSAGMLQRALDKGMHDNRWTWATVPVTFGPYWQYGAVDPILSYKLDEIYERQVGQGAKFADVYDLEMAARHVVTAMQQRGARIDLEYVLKEGQRQADYSSLIYAWGKDNFGISLRSNPSLVKLFEDMGETITVFSEKTGSKSVNKYQLRMFEDSTVHGVAMVAEQVLKMRRAGKFATSYFDSLAEYAVLNGEGNLIHSDIRTLAARTSRMSISRPPLQQLPKNDDLVRKAFIAREERKLIAVDFAQIESRLMAHFSKDKGLQEAFLEADAIGSDFFTIMGRDIYGEPAFRKSDKRRYLVKNTIYGKLYGAGIPTMAESAGVSQAQMEPVVRAIEARYPGIKRFIKDVEHWGIVRQREEGQGYVVTPYGRRLPCDDDKIYALVNYLHQGHAAEIFKKSLVELDMAGWGEFMILPVHDEILLDVPEEHTREAMEEVPRIMGNTTDYAIPLLAEAEGPFDSWGEKYAV